MKISETHLGFIGFGHMAKILFRAIDRAKLIPPSQISFHQRDPAKIKKNEMEFKITSTSLKTLISKSDLLILAVRPHQALSVFDELEGVDVDRSKLLISVVAGLQIQFYQKHWKGGIVRAMPNVASSVYEGMTSLAFEEGLEKESEAVSRLLFSSIGKVLVLNESLMDIATAIAGSGPGFIYQLIDGFRLVGKKQGLKDEDALTLASQTFLGASKMIANGHSLETLLSEIATPNGVTAAGLKKMEELHLKAALEKVVEASFQRSIELSKGF